VAFIVSLISDAMVEDLTEALANTGDDAHSELIRIGRLQDDPEEYDNPILVHENDPNDPDGWCHEQLKQPPLQGPYASNAFRGYFELGGSEMYVRRFTVELKVYLTREGMERKDAKRVMDLVHGRAVHALRNSVRIPGLKDEFGEFALLCKNGVAKSRMMLNGGPPDSWIGEGRIWFEVYTQLP
jgi:hypothetical protein